MVEPSQVCANCAATLSVTTLRCDRCGADPKIASTGQPRFSDEARETGLWLGGLLKLHAVDGARVKYVGWCPAGAFGLDAQGEIAWVEDWGYLSTLTIENGALWLAGKLADIESGKLL
jgi:hypothetical protein